MSSTTLTEIDLREICKEWLNKKMNIRVVHEEYINLDGLHIQLAAEEVEWKKKSGANNDRTFRRTIGFTKSDTSSPRALAQIRATTESQNTITTTIKSGIIKGLNKPSPVRITLDGTGLKSEFRYLEVDPSIMFSEKKDPKKQHSLEKNKMIVRGHSSAVVVHTEKFCKGTFECQIILQGIITYRNPYDNWDYQQYIGSVIQELKEIKNVKGKNKSPDVLDCLKCKNKDASLTLKGTATFRWECGHNLEW